ncbi:MAG: helix-turn-helix transcriptional regulator [Bacteroidetes bacterium]|jgi:transcriptional regulator with XRE-family HTH domain|nr:helix-turn-helix transcriptional regulator [Bacteroidota bacterium]MBT6687955.1 helix-turn-helix transcriptional regulator [Bacteroidota bacterium]MBT7143294.1 helix-turn-helix transcriptional regulator [Bacteroidota bacterium]MBT7490275.1 helix-turn-helix transcriptional regulator [Bacteroidota bacterium]
MKTFGEYIRKSREDIGLPLRKVAAALDIDTSILSKIERNERRATTEMIPILAETLDKAEKEIEIQFIQSAIITDLGELNYLKDGLKEILKTI